MQKREAFRQLVDALLKYGLPKGHVQPTGSYKECCVVCGKTVFYVASSSSSFLSYLSIGSRL